MIQKVFVTIMKVQVPFVIFSLLNLVILLQTKIGRNSLEPVVITTLNIGFLTVGIIFKKIKFKSQCIGLIPIIILPFMV